MSTQHTPGPWFAHPHVLQVSDEWFWYAEDGSRHGNTPNWVIECPDIRTTHMIAAAPDMREALDRMVNHAEHLIKIGILRPFMELDIARAALAKAEGKS